MKNQLSLILIAFFLLLCGACSKSHNPEIKAVNLKCEYMKEALIAKPFPRFSWEIESNQNAQVQTAWQLIVSDNLETLEKGEGNIWDSGKIAGNQTFGIKWQEQHLQSFTRYFWKVRIWDRDGQASNWSETARFISGAFQPSDWKASWIGDHPEVPLTYPLLYKHIGYLSAYAEEPYEEKWVQIDLGEIKDFDRIVLYPSYNNIRGITDYYFPLAYRIEASNEY